MPARQRKDDYNAEAERGYLAHMALRFCGQPFDMEVTPTRGGVHRGRLISVTNDVKPSRSPEQGGSNLALHFADGRTIPLERVKTLARASD